MNLSEICIRRPVFTWVLVSIPVVLGAVSYFELGVDLFPKVDFPVLSVTAIVPGASAEEMEATVTKPLEEAITEDPAMLVPYLPVMDEAALAGTVAAYRARLHELVDRLDLDKLLSSDLPTGGNGSFTFPERKREA